MKGRGNSDRLVFSQPGEQRLFLLSAKERFNCSWEKIAEKIDVHPRSLRDWAREKNNMSFRAAVLISHEANINIPKTAVAKKWKEHLYSIGAGGRQQCTEGKVKAAVREEYRKQKWQDWWQKSGKHKSQLWRNQQQKSFHKAAKSENLAEFIGIMLGDGGISRYQAKITLHSKDDWEYTLYVTELIQKLFHVRPSVTQHRPFNANDIVISRIGLVEYLVNDLGLVRGNKVLQQVDIPEWIKSDHKFRIACVRGLIDTDGGVFTHRYRVNRKEYAYKKLAFTSLSGPLLRSVFDILKEEGIETRITRQSDIRIESRRMMERYMRLIGTHNPKHLKRYMY